MNKTENQFLNLLTTRQAGWLVKEAGPLGEYNLRMERNMGDDSLEFLLIC